MIYDNEIGDKKLTYHRAAQASLQKDKKASQKTNSNHQSDTYAKKFPFYQ